MPVHFSVETGGIALIRVQGANNLNAMTYDMYDHLADFLFRRVDTDPDIKVAILLGEGGNFSVGHDMKAAQAAIDVGADRDVYGLKPFYFKPFPEILSRRMYTPVIGATRGWVLGAAMCYLGLHCSLRIAGESTKFGYTELKRGLIGASIMAMTTRQMPYAMHMLLSATGNTMDARTALAAGFVNEVVPDEAVEPRAREVAALVARNPRVTVKAQKMLQIRGEDMPGSSAALLAGSTWTLNTLDEAMFATMQAGGEA